MDPKGILDGIGSLCDESRGVGMGIGLRVGSPAGGIDVPSGTHPAISFGTHANYIRAFAMLAGASPMNQGIAPSLAALHGRAHPMLEGLERSADLPPVARGQVASSLKNAWGCEAWLAAGGRFATEGELLGLANKWGVIQAYYACYHAVQALLVAKGFPGHESHPKTRKQFMSLWADGPLLLPPWTLGHGTGGFTNVPPGRIIDDAIRQMEPCTDESCRDLASKALRTTREKAIEKALAKARNLRRYSSSVVVSISGPPTGFSTRRIPQEGGPDYSRPPSLSKRQTSRRLRSGSSG